MAKSKLQKKKKCRICESEYTPQRMGQKVCSPKCSFEWVKHKNAKEYDKETRRRKQALKSRGDWIKEAQAEFNKYVRTRDYGAPCISCGKSVAELGIQSNIVMVCGHYLSVGAHPELRFEPLNANLQCTRCNGGAGKYGQFNSNERTITQNYRIRLIEKIGLDKVEWLEGPHEAKNYTIDDVIEIKKKYRKKWKELEKTIDHKEWLDQN